jgi:hypothetical protein
MFEAVSVPGRSADEVQVNDLALPLLARPGIFVLSCYCASLFASSIVRLISGNSPTSLSVFLNFPLHDQ